MATAFLESSPLGNDWLTEESERTFVQPLDRDILPTPPVLHVESTASDDSSDSGTAVRDLEAKREIAPVIRRDQSLVAKRLQVLQQFEGIVLEIDDESFWAELRDLTNEYNPLESAEFAIAQVSPADRGLLMPGCVFYWILGVEQQLGGQIVNVSIIRVRRTPKWTKRVIDSISKKADSLFRLFTDEQEPAA